MQTLSTAGFTLITHNSSYRATASARYTAHLS